MSVTVTEKHIKSKIKSGERIAVIENIKYPHFESTKHKKLCEKMNAFYTSVAEKCSVHARKKLIKRAKIAKLSCSLPMSLSMTYTVSYNSEKVICVVIDLIFSQKNRVAMRRFSQTWSVERGDFVKAGAILKDDRTNKSKLLNAVISLAKENDKKSSFGYFDDYLARLSKYFDIRNSFMVPNGIAFFVNAGILSPVKYGASNFVVPFSQLSDIINPYFLPETAEKDVSKEDIVNNI